MAHPGSLQSCTLCPRRCGVDRLAGQVGACGADASLRLARSALHFWEEPCISGSAGSGTVFFSHCPLKCSYCQNWQIAHEGAGKAATIGALANAVLLLQRKGAHNINLVTATHFAPHVILGIRQARLRGLRIPVVWNTSGYELPETIGLLDGTVDVYLADFKYWRSSESDAAKRYSAAPDYFEVASAALDAMLAQAKAPAFDDEGLMIQGVLVRHLLLPGRLQDAKRILAHLWERFGTQVVYSVMSQYTPMPAVAQDTRLSQRVDPRDYEELLAYMDRLGMQDYFWQEGDPADDSFIPQWDGQGIK